MKKQKIAVIAGKDNLPLQIIEQFKKDKRDFVIITLKGIVDLNDYKQYKTHSFCLGQFKKVFSFLKKEKVQEVVFAGNAKRPSLIDIKLDSVAYKIILKSVTKGLGDDKLLKLVIKEFEDRKIKVIGAHEICKNLTLKKGVLGKIKLSKQDEINIKKGIDVLKAMGDLDVGQSIVVDEGNVLGIEAIEGTEKLIKRCKELKLSKKGGVLVKMKKNSQTDKVDMPTIGVQTIEQISKAGLAGVAIESGNVLVLDQEKVVKKLNELKVFLKIF